MTPERDALELVKTLDAVCRASIKAHGPNTTFAGTSAEVLRIAAALIDTSARLEKMEHERRSDSDFARELFIASGGGHWPGDDSGFLCGARVAEEFMALAGRFRIRAEEAEAYARESDKREVSATFCAGKVSDRLERARVAIEKLPCEWRCQSLEGARLLYNSACEDDEQISVECNCARSRALADIGPAVKNPIIEVITKAVDILVHANRDLSGACDEALELLMPYADAKKLPPIPPKEEPNV